MKKILAVLLALMLCASAGAEGLTIVATSYPMYSTALQITEGLQEVRYEPAEGEASLTVGDVTILASACALAPIEGDTDTLTVPVNVMIFASLLGDVLNAQDPENNATYQERISALVTEYSDLDLALREVVTADTAIACDDGSMAYFAAEYGVKLAEDGTVLHTYDTPSEEDAAVSYLELMQRNLAALQD